MLSKKVFAVLLLNIIYTANSAYAPFIQKCKSDDSKCIKTATQNAIPIIANGIPEMGVEQLDPIYIKYLDASTKGLSLKLSEVSGTGLKDCIAKKVERDPAKSKLFVTLQCSVDFKAKYEMSGRLLVLPIEGKGDAHVVLRKAVIDVEVDVGDNVGRDGQNHWVINNWKHSYDLKEKSTIELENLFNGNEVLGRAARELIASSSNEVVKEVGPPIVSAFVERIVKNVDKFFATVPASELSID